MTGDEEVYIENLHQYGGLSFYIPNIQFNARVSIGERIEEPLVNLETVVVEPDKDLLSLVWRSELSCDKQSLDIHEVEINQKNA